MTFPCVNYNVATDLGRCTAPCGRCSQNGNVVMRDNGERMWIRPQRALPDDGGQDSDRAADERAYVAQAAEPLHELKPADMLRKTDPWVHRSSGMQCRTCMWFAPKVDAQGIYTVGRCRRHAPTMNGYPVVYPTDWCGDHKLDETKVNK